MTRTVINGHLVVGGVEAACSACVFKFPPPDWQDTRAACDRRGPVEEWCKRYPTELIGAKLVMCVQRLPIGFCGEFLPREPKEEEK